MPPVTSITQLKSRDCSD